MSTTVQLRRLVEARVKELRREIATLESVLNGHGPAAAPTRRRPGKYLKVAPRAKNFEVQQWITAVLGTGPKDRKTLYQMAISPTQGPPFAKQSPLGKRGRTKTIQHRIGTELWKSVKIFKTVSMRDGKFHLVKVLPPKELGRIGKITSA